MPFENQKEHRIIATNIVGLEKQIVEVTEQLDDELHERDVYENIKQRNKQEYIRKSEFVKQLQKMAVTMDKRLQASQIALKFANSMKTESIKECEDQETEMILKKREHRSKIQELKISHMKIINVIGYFRREKDDMHKIKITRLQERIGRLNKRMRVFEKIKQKRVVRKVNMSEKYKKL